MNLPPLKVGERVNPPALYLNDVHVAFDGFKAINGLNLIVERGELRAIIGPNGAGKTTMMDIITGKTRPDKGEVFLRHDIDLTRLDEAQIANLGVGRKFQKPSVFESHTVGANLELARKDKRGPFSTMFARPTMETEAKIAEILSLIGLTEKRDWLAGALSHGQKQWLEIGMLLIQDPEIMLVDEPVAGMTDHETEQTAVLLKEIARTRSVVVVEHDMSFVESLGATVTVLHEGRVIAEGPLAVVREDPQVIEVYLGR